MATVYNLITGDPRGIVPSKSFADRLVPGDFFKAPDNAGLVIYWTVRWCDMTPVGAAGGTVACEPGGPPPP